MSTGTATQRAVGSIVQVRGRDWVVLPSDLPNILKLRPLSGGEEEISAIHLGSGRQWRF